MCILWHMVFRPVFDTVFEQHSELYFGSYKLFLHLYICINEKHKDPGGGTFHFKDLLKVKLGNIRKNMYIIAYIVSTCV